MNKKLRVTIVLAVALAALGACNAMEGFGKDLRQLGNAIERKAGN
jgi:predicted small secreted protein